MNKKVYSLLTIFLLLIGTVYAVAPVITDPTGGDYISGTYRITWSGDENPWAVEYDDGGWIPICGSTGNQYCDWDTTVPLDGSYDIRITDTNSNEDQITVNVKNAVPAAPTGVTLDDPINLANVATTAVSGSSPEADGSAVDCTIYDGVGGSVSGADTLTAGAFSYTIDTTAIADAIGTVTANCSITDLALASGPDGESAASTKDTVKPTLTPVTIVSDNADPTLAIIGNTVTITFTASEGIGLPAVGDVQIDGNDADAINDLGGGVYTAERLMVGGETNGVIAFTIDVTDDNGNAGDQVSAITAGSDVTFDDGVPTITAELMTPADPSLDNTPDISFTISDATGGIDATSISVNDGNGNTYTDGAGLTCTDMGGGLTYDCIGTISAYPDGDYTLSIDGSDNMANPAVTVSIAAYTVDTADPTSSDAYVGGSWETVVPVTVTITESDPGPSSGVASTMYCVDQLDSCDPSTGTDITGGGPVDVSTEGVNYLRYATTDLAGNVQATAPGTQIDIDSVAPAEATVIPATFSTSPFNVEVTVTEDTSGLVGGTCDVYYNKAGAGYGASWQTPATGTTIYSFTETSGLVLGDTVVFKVECTDLAGLSSVFAEYTTTYSLTGVYIPYNETFAGDVSGQWNALLLGADVVSDNEIDYTTVTLADFTDDVGYLTVETDPVYSADPAAGIAAGDITNWDLAYGWGNHALAGYLTVFVESDPVFTAWDKDYADLINTPTTLSQFTDDIGVAADYDECSDLTACGFLSAESDPTVLASVKDGVDWTELSGVPADIADGDDDTQLNEAQVDAFVANNGYLSAETDPTVLASVKDGVDWTELTGIPADIADGDDDTVYDDTALQAQIDDLEARVGDETTGVNIALKQGWNEFRLPAHVLVGTAYTSALNLGADYSVANVLSSIIANVDYISYYDGSTWRVYVPGVVTTDFTTFPTAANSPDVVFHIHMTATDTLAIATI
ncbi:hypothetical protein ACFL0W_05570 [Nanoarchaeota archaeon]